LKIELLKFELYFSLACPYCVRSGYALQVLVPLSSGPVGFPLLSFTRAWWFYDALKILSSLRSAKGGEAVCVLSYYNRLFYTKPEVKALKKNWLVAEHQPKENHGIRLQQNTDCFSSADA